MEPATTSLSLGTLVDQYPNLEKVLDIPCPVIAILSEKEITLGRS